MADSGFVDVKPLETSSLEVVRESLSNTFPPSTTEGVFNSLQVGVGNYVLHISEDGLWLGAENFEDAPFSVSMDGTTTIGGGGSIEGALYIGEAAEDINTHTTTISGGKITTGTITADQLAVGSVISSKIASGAIISEKIAAGEVKAVNIAAGTIATSHIATNAITGTLLADGSVSEVKIANAAVTGGKIADATITGGKIANTTITGSNIVNSTITATKLSVSTLDAISANLGTITAGTLSAVSISGATITAGTISGTVYITLPYGTTSTGYLRFGNSGNRIWADTSNYMGFRSEGNRFYFYTGDTIYALFQRYTQASFYSGISASGARSYFSGGLTVSDTGATINGGTAIYNGLYLSGTSQFNCHINTITNNNYNLGGSSAYWRYVNCYRVSERSLTSFDSPVEMRDGKLLDDIGALKAIKEDTIIDDVTGRPFLDKRSFPKDVLVPAYDQETGKPYKRDKNDRPLVPDKNGKLVARPDADGISIGQLLSLLFGGFKQLVKRVEELEKKFK